MVAVKRRLIACMHLLRIYSFMLSHHLTELRTGTSETEFQSCEGIKSFVFLSCIISPANSIQYQMFHVRCSGKFYSPACWL